MKDYYAENDDSPIIHGSRVTSTSCVLQSTGSGVIHISKRSVLFRC